MSGIGPVSQTPDIDLYIGPYNPLYFGALIAAVANEADFMAFKVLRPITVSAASIEIGVQSGNLDVGIYQHTANGAGTRLVSSGSTAVGAPGTQSVALAPTRLVPGVRYFAAVAFDNATVTAWRSQCLSDQMVNLASMGYRIAASFPLPASFAGVFSPPNRSWMVTFQ